MQPRMLLLVGATALAIGSALPVYSALADPCSNQHQLNEPQGKFLATHPGMITSCPKPPFTGGHHLPRGEAAGPRGHLRS